MTTSRVIPSAMPVKTERTREENQERAYIAASRRSDRSLEARVESARKASEIHKKRTGRSLRVTAQDVLNEEFYEEEIDDLPMIYKFLATYLQTDSAAFDQRLAAYLTNHVAMRSILESSIQQSYQPQQFQTTQQYEGGPSLYQSPMSPQPQQQKISKKEAHIVTQNMSPNVQQAMYSYAASPTPQPSTPDEFRPTPRHQRPASIAIPDELRLSSETSSPIIQGDMSRRQTISGLPPLVKTKGTPGLAATIDAERRFVSALSIAQFPQTQLSFRPNYNMGGFNNNTLPFSSALPAEPQRLLGNSLNLNDPITLL